MIDWEARANANAHTVNGMLAALLDHEYDGVPIRDALAFCHELAGRLARGGLGQELCENLECQEHGWPETGLHCEAAGQHWWLCAACARQEQQYPPLFVPAPAGT